MCFDALEKMTQSVPEIENYLRNRIPYLYFRRIGIFNALSQTFKKYGLQIDKKMTAQPLKGKEKTWPLI